MDELLAIIIIVIVCCAMFFAWLISMATCPDAMVNLIGGSGSSQYGSSHDSKELIMPGHKCDDDERTLEARSGSVYLQLNGKRVESNKLSTVAEGDEQMTVQIPNTRTYPSILRPPSIDQSSLQSMKKSIIKEPV